MPVGPVEVDMVFARGEAITWDFIVYQRDPATGAMTSTPRNITGWTMAFTLADDYDIVPKRFTVTASVTNGATGEGRVVLSGNAGGNTDLPQGEYKADLWRTNANQEELLALVAVQVKGDARLPT